MDIKKFIPSAPQVSREFITILVGTLVAAFVISKVPAFKRLVNDNSLL